MKKTLVNLIVGGGIILSGFSGLEASKAYYPNKSEALEAIVEYDYSYGNNYAQEQEEHQQTPDEKEYLQAFNTQSVDEKIRLFEAFVSKWPNSKERKHAYGSLAGLYYNPKHDFDKAIENANKALAYADLELNWQVDMYIALSVSYYSHPTKKDIQKGAEYANKAYEIANNNSLEGDYLKRAKTLKEAFDKELAAKPKAKPAPVQRPLESAIKLYNQKNYSGAADAFSKLDQKDPKVAYHYGLSLYQNKKFNESIDKLLAASILDSAAYPKARDTAYSIFLNNVFKEPKSKRDYNSVVKETNDLMNSDIAELQKAWNDKYADKELSEEEAKKDEINRAAWDRGMAQIRKDTEAYQLGLKKAAGDAFERLIDDTRKRLGLK